MKIKKIIKNILLFVLLVFITYFIIFRKQNMKELFSTIASANKWYLLIAFLSMTTYFIVDAIDIKSVLKSLDVKVPFLKMFKFTLIGTFFCSITPAATGGQPAQIYYMNKSGIKISKSTTALLVHLNAYQFSTIFLAILCFIINPNVLPEHTLWLFIIGISANSLIMLVAYIAIFNHKLAKKIMYAVLKVLKIIRFKNIDNAKKKIDTELELYKENSKYIKNHKKEIVFAMIRTTIQTVFYYLVPFFVYKALGLTGYNIFEVFVIQSVFHGVTSAIPLPGAVGISEGVFLRMFLPVYTSSLIKSGMLLSRSISFYIFVLIGMTVTLITSSKLNKD